MGKGHFASGALGIEEGVVKEIEETEEGSQEI